MEGRGPKPEQKADCCKAHSQVSGMHLQGPQMPSRRLASKALTPFRCVCPREARKRAPKGNRKFKEQGKERIKKEEGEEEKHTLQ